MYLGILQVELELFDPTNLKEKRRIVRSLKDKLRQLYECSVAEVGVLDILTEATLGIAIVSNEGKHARQRCQAILNFIEKSRDARVVDFEMEVL